VERFARVLQQRNALLRSWQGQRPSPSARAELEVWDSEFITAADQLLGFRETTVAQLAPLVVENYHALSHSTQAVGVTYERSWTGDLHEALQRAFIDDVQRGYSTCGPHRDDIALYLDGRDARRQASQGEQRSFALALRLAGHSLVQQRRGVDPLLLLDDVFSELDPFRSERLLQLLPVGQTIVTTATPLPRGMVPAAIVDITRD
jgi:DNA replication and repair protein RecF